MYGQNKQPLNHSNTFQVPNKERFFFLEIGSLLHMTLYRQRVSKHQENQGTN